MTLGQLSKMSDAEIAAFSRGHNQCPRCKGRIDLGPDTGQPHRVTDRGKAEFICDDCYYDAVGELVEEHPIGVPHRRGRGCGAIE